MAELNHPVLAINLFERATASRTTRAARSSGRTRASAPPYRPTGVRTAFQSYPTLLAQDGTVDVSAGSENARSVAEYHQSFWGEVEPKNGRYLTPAKAINHTDEEMEYLAKLVNQRTAWEIAGRKGVKDGAGYMEQQPPSAHPAMQLK
mgnify:CR=1 FL=1